MKSGFVVLALVLSLVVGCGLPAKEVKREDREFVVVEVDPPKRFYLSFRDVVNGAHYDNVYVQKRCSGWEKAFQGSTWTLPEITYERSDGTRYKQVDVTPLRNKLC